MNPIRLSCDGMIIGSLVIPPFQLKAGEFICLHLPGPAGSKEEVQLIQILTGKSSVSGLRLFGRVLYASPATDRRGFFRFLRPLRPADWLRQSAGISRQEAGAIVARLGIKQEWHLSQLASNPSTLLGLEAAWAQGAEVILFSTSGCDPSGIRAVFNSVSSHLDRTAAIYLSLPFFQGGKLKRNYFPGALCLEVTLQTAASSSMSQA
jgi:hypothetical protein